MIVNVNRVQSVSVVSLCLCNAAAMQNILSAGQSWLVVVLFKVVVNRQPSNSNNYYFTWGQSYHFTSAPIGTIFWLP
jgi:hypothetical protein